MRGPANTSLLELGVLGTGATSRALPGKPALPPTVELLRQVYARGGWIARNGGQMKLLADHRSVPEELLRSLRDHRSEILEILTTHPCAGCRRFAFPAPGTLCYWCRKRS